MLIRTFERLRRMPAPRLLARRFAVIVTAGLTLALAVQMPAQVASPPAPPVDLQASAQLWSQKVWQSAMAGDFSSVDAALRAVPADPSARAGIDRLRQSFDLHLSNVEKARDRQATDLAKAETDMSEAIAKDQLSKALRAAVSVQTLGPNLEAALQNPEIRSLMTKAQGELKQAQQNNDWLQAQELLFYLRTIHEDTSHVVEFQKYKDELDAVNRRVSLLAQYAPRALHELRTQRAERIGDPALGEFRWNKSMEWQQKVKGVKPDMLKVAMRNAAEHHIEAKGWRPLLEGGLEELKILASTASLDEAFPKLADKAAVKQWTDGIDRTLHALNQAEDRTIDNWYFSKMLDELKRTNDASIQLDDGVLYREFGDGAMYRLDQFSEIIWPDKLARFTQLTEGNFVGVGIIIRHSDAQDIIVVNPLEGTPAYFAGVKPNDVIASVDGESTVGWSLTDAVDRITGEPDTKVTLSVKREGVEGLIPLTLTRQQIHLPSVNGWWKKNLRADGAADWDWYVDPASRVAYIKISQFTEETALDLQRAWREITAQGKPTGLIIDLRYNPGGLLISAVAVSNLFVRSGVIVTGEDKDGQRPESFPDQRADPRRSWDLEGVGVVVLINQGSASASEIVAGCLQAHSAAVIVGERSFGKGSVQTVHRTAANARMKLTTQYYRLPPSEQQVAKGSKGSLVHKRPGQTEWGVKPTIEVKMTPQQSFDALELRQKADALPQDENGNVDPSPEKRPDVMRLLTEGIDPQLETALLILQARALGISSGDTRHAAREGDAVPSGG